MHTRTHLGDESDVVDACNIIRIVGSDNNHAVAVTRFLRRKKIGIQEKQEFKIRNIKMILILLKHENAIDVYIPRNRSYVKMKVEGNLVEYHRGA